MSIRKRLHVTKVIKKIQEAGYCVKVVDGVAKIYNWKIDLLTRPLVDFEEASIPDLLQSLEIIDDFSI
jgi:hypothetical protein